MIWRQESLACKNLPSLIFTQSWPIDIFRRHKIKGTCKKGADVQKIEFNKTMAETLSALFNEIHPVKQANGTSVQSCLNMTSWNTHLAFKDYQREKTQKIAL